eukprot:4183013-Amphidinium_carterae.1
MDEARASTFNLLKWKELKGQLLHIIPKHRIYPHPFPNPKVPTKSPQKTFVFNVPLVPFWGCIFETLGLILGFQILRSQWRLTLPDGDG